MQLDPLTRLPEIERDWMNAWIAKDRAAFEEILDDEFLLSSARGVLVRKPEWLAGAMSVFSCQEFEWKAILVRPFQHVALVHSTIRQVASVAGQDWSGVFMLTDAWVLRGDRWKVVSRHGTGPLPDAVA
jgi:hypothetical protein